MESDRINRSYTHHSENKQELFDEYSSSIKEENNNRPLRAFIIGLQT